VVQVSPSSLFSAGIFILGAGQFLEPPIPDVRWIFGGRDASQCIADQMQSSDGWSARGEVRLGRTPPRRWPATNNLGNDMTKCIDGGCDSIAIGGRKRRWTLPVFIVDVAGFVIWALIPFSRDWI
jgi:hypothetical protein